MGVADHRLDVHAARWRGRGQGLQSRDRHVEEDGSATRWVQLNPTTDNHANWVSMGKLLEDTFDKYFDWEEFTVLLILTNQNKSVETINRFGRYLSQLLI